MTLPISPWNFCSFYLRLCPLCLRLHCQWPASSTITTCSSPSGPSPKPALIFLDLKRLRASGRTPSFLADKVGACNSPTVPLTCLVVYHGNSPFQLVCEGFSYLPSLWGRFRVLAVGVWDRGEWRRMVIWPRGMVYLVVGLPNLVVLCLRREIQEWPNSHRACSREI